MSQPLLLTLLIAAAYLLGAIPFGILFSRMLKGQDPRLVGSGNIGFTNVYRAAGATAALLTLFADISKGLLPVLIAQWWHLAPWGVALAAVVGHCFSIYLRFRGGKGVATSLGALIGFDPPVGLVILGIWLLTVAVTRYISLGAVVAAGLLPLTMIIIEPTWTRLALGLALSALVIISHHDNIQQLRAGTESKLLS